MGFFGLNLREVEVTLEFGGAQEIKLEIKGLGLATKGAVEMRLWRVTMRPERILALGKAEVAGKRPQGLA